MKRIYTVEEKQAMDKLAEEKFGIPPIVLMENAATNISNSIIYRKNEITSHFAIFCGVGNNGGDGMAIARHLLSDGFKVKVWVVGDLSKMTAATKTNMEILQRINPTLVQVLQDTDGIIKIVEELKIHNRNIIIDAIYGIGFRGDVIKDSLVRDLLKKLNEFIDMQTRSLEFVVDAISIDVPSGFDASTGKNAKEMFKAHTVYDIGGRNFFNCNYNDLVYADRIVVSLGYGGGIECNNMQLKKDERRFPPRKYHSNAHKYDFGKVVIIAGSKDMPGAAALCSNAAIKTGAGIVELLTPKIHDSLLPEIISPELETKNSCFDLSHFDFINEKIQSADAVVIGPGMSKNEDTMALVRKLVFSNLEKRWVIDGDGIGAFSADDVFSPSVIFTPHLGEFRRLTGNKELLENSIELYNFLKATAKQMNCVFLLKGEQTMITDGAKTYFNYEGSARMATAGSGDVLTGIIASNLAQYRQDLPDKDLYEGKIDFDITKNVAISSYIHTSAGKWAMGTYREHLFTASDIIDSIQHIQEI